MNQLFSISDRKIEATNFSFVRYLYSEIEWNLPLIILKGARGVGKTTLLLQRAKQLKEQNKKILYCSLDHPYFETNRLYDLATYLYENKIYHLFIDEIHKYEFWAKDLKAINDAYDKMKVVATGSSILNIIQGEADLSRRIASYDLAGLSFREYLNFKENQDFETYKLFDILKNHAELSDEIAEKIDILKHFEKYLKIGYYPFFKESIHQFPNRLLRTTYTVIENDIPAFENIDYQSVRNLRKLLYYISTSVPYTPNITQLAQKVGTSRPQLLKMLDYLERAQILLLLKSGSKGVSKMTKPDKIFLQNTNLAYIFETEEPNLGMLRETFFYNQLKVKYMVTHPKYGDFLVEKDYVFEIGGAGKSFKQIAGVPKSYIAADSILQGQDRKIPLWMFGFLY